MATITTDTYLDGGTARTAGEAFAIGSGAKFTIRTDSRLHANAPASMLGSMGNPTFTDIGGEYAIDATAVRWLAFNTGTGNVPAIGTAITQGAVSGYFLGVWASYLVPPTASGSAMPTSGYIKFREVTGGTFSAGALTGIGASATGVDKVGWIELIYDTGTNFVVPRVGKFSSRGDWFELGETNGAVGQEFYIPTTSTKKGLNYSAGAWVETAPASGVYDYWPSLNGQANGWSYRHIGYPQGYTDKRGRFFQSLFGGSKLKIGQEYNLKTTYASVAAQSSTYAGTTVAGTYTWAGNVLTVDCGTNLHLLEVGMQCGFDFTSGTATDQILTITNLLDAYKFQCTLAGSGTGGNVTLRPGVTITFTAHGLAIGNDVGCDFTTGTGVDGVYKVYSVDSANAYKVNYPHLVALTSGAVSCLHTVRFTVPTAINITDVAFTANYTYTGYILTVVCAVDHQLLEGQTVGIDFTTGGLTTDANYQVLEVVNSTTFTAYVATASGTAGTCTVRPGVIVALTAHQKTVGESQFYNFAATVTDGDYPVYAVDSVDQYKIAVPHLVAYASTTASIEHGLAVGNNVYIDATSGTLPDGIYTIRTVPAVTTFDINYGHLVALTTSNAYVRQTEGYIPVSGCKVRIPNIIINECTTALRSQNQAPNGTIASRPEITTTTAGALDLEYIYGESLYAGAIGQAYSCRLHHCSFVDSVSISEIATALDIDDIGVSMYASQDLRTVVFTSCFAGGTVNNVTAYRGNAPGTTDHAFEMLYCTGQTLNNIRAGIIQFARSTGATNIAYCQNITANNIWLQHANMLILSCVNIILNDTDYIDRVIGKTNATSGLYVFVISGASNTIKIDGITVGLLGTIADTHPYSGFISFTASLNLKFRNIGTFSSPVNTGAWEMSLYNTLTPFVSGGNNNNIKIQRTYFQRLKTSLFTTVNSDKNVLYEHLWQYPYFYGTGTGTPKAVATIIHASLNCEAKALRTGTYSASGQTSVYGSHFMDNFKGDDSGALLLMMNEPTSETSQYVTVNSGIVKFNSSGGVEMRAIGAQATWEMPYYCLGHTAFANITPVMSGGTIGNYTLEYQIDINNGSGYNGAWKTLSTANLTTETITSGFKLKIRITTGIANATAITFLRIYTVATTTSQNAINYPLDTVDASLVLSGLKAGTEIHVYQTSNEQEITSIESSGTSYTYNYKWVGSDTNIFITVIKPGYQWIRYDNMTLGEFGLTIPVFQSIDRTYSNPV